MEKCLISICYQQKRKNLVVGKFRRYEWHKKVLDFPRYQSDFFGTGKKQIVWIFYSGNKILLVRKKVMFFLF